MKTKTSTAPCTYLLIGAFAFFLINYCSARQTAPQSTPASIPGNYDYSDRPANPAMAQVQDDPKLPRVLLIGDSISIGYTLPVRKRLAGVANVHRIPANGGPTTNGLAYLTEWLNTTKWDVIHFNWGLHDLKVTNDGQHMVPLADYGKNLATLVERLKKSGAKLIWATTTPVPEGKLNPPRKPGDVAVYNSVAKKIMEQSGIAIDDLYGFARPKLAQIQIPANVHFTAEGSTALAEQVANSILTALGKTQKQSE